MFRSGNVNLIIATQCYIFITEILSLKMATLLKLGLNYGWYHVAHVFLKHRHCGWLKYIVTSMIQTYKSVPLYRPTHYTVEVGVTVWIAALNISRRCCVRLFSVSSWYHQSSISVLFCLGNVTPTSRSRDSDVLVSTSYVSFTTLVDTTLLQAVYILQMWSTNGMLDWW